VISGYVGRPGSGKTYTMSELAVRNARRGRRVFTNWPVACENVFYFRPDQLMDLPPGLVMVDEAHLWFPARMALKLPMSWLAGLSQTRKNSWDLVWSAQHENRVDRVVRDVTNLMYLCSAWFQYNGHPMLFSADCFEPEHFRDSSKSLGKTRRLFNQQIADSYDTFGRIEGAEHTQDANDPYAKARSKRGGSVLEGLL
jgi:zona occludens toxin (predicted ATPase)